MNPDLPKELVEDPIIEEGPEFGTTPEIPTFDSFSYSNIHTQATTEAVLAFTLDDSNDSSESDDSSDDSDSFPYEIQTFEFSNIMIAQPLAKKIRQIPNSAGGDLQFAFWTNRNNMGHPNPDGSITWRKEYHTIFLSAYSESQGIQSDSGNYLGNESESSEESSDSDELFESSKVNATTASVVASSSMKNSDSTSPSSRSSSMRAKEFTILKGIEKSLLEVDINIHAVEKIKSLRHTIIMNLPVFSFE
ncbi:uncharacterized protein LOC131306777 [Rhododendron vialii]|uniref:uncharacterized protein LOC131306777 n=1 Tax=Rhododendron vialii TaxID=182163 RepID=UPI00265FC50F|nr:uncharacterized protein LOC131306777 [Rhododendron vialii]